MRMTKRAFACGLLLLATCLSGCTQLLGGNAELPQRRWFKVNVKPMRNGLENSERPYPFQVQIKEVVGEHAHVLELQVAKEDLGKVIGKGGAHASAIRTLMAAASGKEKKRYILEIIEY